MGLFTDSTVGIDVNESDVVVENPGGFFGGASEQPGNLIQLDGDTWYDNNTEEKYRLEGAYAPETTKASIASDGSLEVDHGEPWGEEVKQAVHQIQQQGGFNQVVKTGETDSHGREIVRFVNDRGEDLTQVLYRNGVLRPDQHSKAEATRQWELGEFARDLGVDQPYEESVQQLENAKTAGMGMVDGLGIPEFSRTAETEKQAFYGNKFQDLYNLYDDNPEFDDPTIDNTTAAAKNSYGAAFEQGWHSVKDGVQGALEIFGLADINPHTGQSIGAERLANMQAEFPEIENMDFDSVNGVGDFMQFLGNNMAMSVPYMGIIAASAIAAPAGAIGAAASTLPVGLVYAGQTWNDMEGNKGAAQRGAALGAGLLMGTVDRLGLAGLIKPSSLLTDEGKDVIVDALIREGKATTREEGLKQVNDASKEVAVGMLRGIDDVAGKQLIAKTNAKDLATEIGLGIARGTLAEGTTEAMQETIQYAAATQFSDKDFDADILADRIRDAFIAGGALGAGFGATGAAWQYGDRLAAQRDLDRAELDRLTGYEQVREDRRRRGEQLDTVEGILEKNQERARKWAEKNKKKQNKKKKKGKKANQIDETGTGSFAKRARKWQRESRGFVNNLKQITSVPEAIAKGIGGIKKLYQAASVTAFSPQELANGNYGKTLSELRALLGQQRGVIHSGMSFEAHKDRIYGTISSMTHIPQVMARFGLREQTVSKKNRNNVSRMLRKFGRTDWAKLKRGEITKEQVSPEFRENIDALIATAKEMDAMSDSIYDVQKNTLDPASDKLNYLENWWAKSQSFDPGKVAKNKEAWMKWMRDNTDLSEAELADFFDRMEGGQATNLDEYFSHVGGAEYTPGSHEARTKNLSEIEGYEQFAQDDLFTDMDTAAMKAARFATNRKYWGAGGRNLDYLFDKLKDEGMPEDKLNELAWYTKAIIDAESGNFNRITDYRWAGVQRFATTWSILAGLPLSALSSFPEMAMVGLGLDGKEVPKAISDVGEQVAGAFIEQAKRVMDMDAKDGTVKAVNDDGQFVPYQQARLNMAGLAWSPSSAAQRVGIGETNISYQWVQDTFFKGIGLAQLTQGQRRANAAMVTDFVANRLAELNAAGDLSTMTNRQQHVYNQLAELGLDVPRMLEMWSDYGNSNSILDYAESNREIPPEIMSEIDSNMQLAVYNFVNTRIQNPGAANRPLFFQDPHYQLLTQFNGFLSTFTANVVPKLWNDYIRKGPPSVKYKTFALMMTLMALGAAGQYLKDWIKYGRVTPYLDSGQQLQRAIYSSGVLGQGERIVDTVLPLYGGKPQSTLQHLFDIAVGEAGPTVRTLGTLGEAIGQVSEDPAQAAQTAAKVTPLIGPLGRVRKGAVGALFGEGQEQFDFYDNL